MASKNQLEVQIRASIANAAELHKELQEKLGNDLVVFSDKDMRQLANRIYEAQQLLDKGLFKQARKAAESLNNFVLSSLNKIGIEAGAASNQLAELEQKLQALKKERAKLQDPNDQYTSILKPIGGRLKRRSALTDTELGALGIHKDPTTGSYQSDLLDKEHNTLPKNWSVASYAYNLADRYKGLKEDDPQRKQIENALSTLGLTLTNGVLKVKESVEQEFQDMVRAFQQASASLDQKIHNTETQLLAERSNTEGAKVTGDNNQSFDTKKYYDTTTTCVAKLQEETDNYNRTLKKEQEQQNKLDDELEEAVVEQHKVNQVVDQGTEAQNKQTNAVGRAVTTFFGYQMVLRQLRRLWREAIHTIKELDKQLTTQALVTGMTREETWQLIGTYQELANQSGLTQTEVAGVTTEYLRQGETLSNALTLTKAATAAATVAGISASDSVKYLTTAIHGFKLEAEDALAVSDKFAALAAQAATNYEDLAVALSKVASQAQLAGMSMDYTLALLTTGLDVTQEAPESIGTALKTVIARMREISDYGKTLDDEMSLNQVESGLKAVGIELRSTTGELRSSEAVLDELGRKWTELSANQQAAVAKALAGTRQQSRLVAIMENYDDVIQNMNVANNSLGATTAQQVTYLQGMEAAMNRLQNAYQSVIEGLVKSDFVIGIVNTISGLLQKVQKFLNNPAGRTALITGILSFLLRSRELIDKVRNVVNQLLAAVSNLHKHEEAITAEKKKQLSIYEKQVAAESGVSKELQEKAGIGKTQRPNGWLSNRPGESNFLNALGTIFNPRQWGGEGAERRKNTWQSWWENNSLHAKISEALATRKVRKQMVMGAEQSQRNLNNDHTSLLKSGLLTDEQREKLLQTPPSEDGSTGYNLAFSDAQMIELLKKEEELAEARKRTEEATKAATEAANDAADAQDALNDTMADEDADVDDINEAAEASTEADEVAKQAEEARKKAAEEEAKIQAEVAKLRESGKLSEEDLAKQRKVLNASTLTNEEKIAYLANQKKLAAAKEKQAKIDELNAGIKEGRIKKEELTEEQKQLLSEEQSTQEDIKQASAEMEATEKKGFGAQTGQRFSTAVSAATGIASAASGIVSMIQGMVDTIQNRYKEIVDNAIEKGNEIQSKIYENTQTMTNLQNLSDDLRKLDRQVVKTADSMKELQDVRAQLLTELELTEAEGKLYTNQQLYDKAIAKRAELENKNQELLLELGDTLLGAANNYDGAAGAVNILSKMAMGAGLGAAATGWMATTGIGAVGTAIGTAVGAVIGTVVGVIEEINKKMAADDAKGKVHEMLQTDEGVSQLQYYFKAVYKDVVDTSTIAGQELSKNVKTTYASLIDSLSGEDMEKLLNKYDWNAQAMADSVANTLAAHGDSLKILTSDYSNYTERVEAAADMYAALAEESEELGNAFLEQYGSYIQLGALLGDNVQVMDKYKWSLSDMNELLSQLAEDGWSADQMSEAVRKLGDAMDDGTLSNSELTDALGNMSDAALKAVGKLISGGEDMQSLADQFTYAKNQVKNIRETQSKWGSMSASERQSFIAENEDFFNQEGAYEKFINGEDITELIEAYKKELQSGLVDTTKNLILTTEAELYRLQREYNEATDDEQREALKKRIASAERELKQLKDTYEDVNSMFNLTLAEIVDKQNQQIAKLKEMYQAEEKALVDSLNKRKEAYQKYFDTLEREERIEDYTTNRDQLMSSISRLSGGTDATSRNKIRELQKQLKELEEQEAKQRREDARQAVLENIDGQVEQIQEQFSELLSNNKELLSKMDASTELQYRNYLATLGLTDEDIAQRVEQLGDLFKGSWGEKGISPFTTTPTTPTPTVTVEPGNNTSNIINFTGTDGQTHEFKLTRQQMNDILNEFAVILQRKTGVSFASSSKK